ncbi:MAG: hypothetical protein ABJF10_04845 [Chthoniobacter sp.]|uniref:hypothetical protein n=1 Tax=Chthoniobacter sp. TaxID=2510640 RepID=UPI0032A1AECD
MGELTGKVSESIKDVRASLEEWGTLTLSGLLLAPPIMPSDSKNPKDWVGTFGIDINGTKLGDVSSTYNFNKWFKEASTVEGTAQFTEQIFNSLVASGTLQLAPEQAAIAQSLFQKQQVDQQLFQGQLDRNRIVSDAALKDASQTRADRQQARQIRLDAGKAAVDRATTASREADAAEAAAQKNADAAAVAANGDPNAPAVQKANADLATAKTNQTARAKELTDARTARDKLLNSSIDESDLPKTTLAEHKTSPVLPTPTPAPGAQAGFSFASTMDPGQSLINFSTELKKSGNSKLPNASPTDLPTKLGGAENGLGPTPKADLTPTLGDPNSSVFPARARLIDAASNQTISRIFDFLGNPSAALQFTDKPILMAAGTIAVNPGWRTWREYDGQIDVSTKYVWKPARRVTCERLAKVGATGLFNPDEIAVANHFAQTGLWPAATKGSRAFTGTIDDLKNTSDTPLAAAVSPLMEHQNIDEASSRARQDEIAIFLSASLAKSGQKAAADVFDKYIRLRRLDVKTRSSLPVVNSYGLGGNRFGFNVTARLQAIGDTNKPKAQTLLDKQNFPVLVVLGLSSEDLRPRLVWNTEGTTPTAEIWEPEILLSQTHRWGRQRKRGDFHQVLRSIFYPGYPGRPMQNPTEAYEHMYNADYWLNELKVYLNEHHQLQDNSETVGNFLKVADENYDFLRTASYGASTWLDIPVEVLVGKEPPPPPDRTPVISSVVPTLLKMRKGKSASGADQFEADVLLMGANLDLVSPAQIASLPSGATIIPTPLPPGILPKQALALRIAFRTLPSRFQLMMPAGEATAGVPHTLLFSPTVSALPPAP